MNSRRSRRDATGCTSPDSPPTAPYMATAIDVFAKVRGHERAEQLQAARDADLLPYFRLVESPAAPVVEMEGAERIMLGSNNYLGLTGDERVMQGARDALEQYGTGLTGSRLLNGTTQICTSTSSASWRSGWAPRRRSSSPPATRPTSARSGTLLAPGRHRDRRLGRPRLDPRRLPALAREAAPVPPQPARQAREDARARGGRRRRRARGGRRRVLDGGRRRAAAARSSSCARRTARG